MRVKLVDEAAARIVQATYLLLKSPNPPIPPRYFRHHLDGAIALAKEFELDTKPGEGTYLSVDDLHSFTLQIPRYEPAYRNKAGMVPTNGISKKDYTKIKYPKVTQEETTTHVTFHPMAAYRVPTDALFDFNKHNIKAGGGAGTAGGCGLHQKFHGPR